MESHNQSYFEKLQLITVSKNGVILSTGKTLFDLQVTNNIKDFHPVFETTLQLIVENNLAELIIPGLNITNDERQFYCDVRLTKENGYITILFFNFTSKYKNKFDTRSRHNKSEIERNKQLHVKHHSFIKKTS